MMGIDGENPDAATDPAGDAGLRARQLVQIYLHLHALTGNDSAAMTHWMQTKSGQLDSSTVERMQTIGGLDQTLSYLESLQP
jgi:hypothetical protein